MPLEDEDEEDFDGEGNEILRNSSFNSVVNSFYFTLSF